jgi:predicted ATPase/DNA-binding SARP family transcriptional activator
MRFGLLGPLAVWTDAGDVVAVPGAKVRALLADLLIHEGRPVSADRLVDDLWGAEPPGNPAGALQAKVSQLRRVLEDAEPGGRELLVSRPPGYLLRIDADSVDAARFAALVGRARTTEDPRARAALLTDALALWRGPALADFGDEPFAQAAVARLEEDRLVAIEERVQARLALGEHGELVGELGDLVARYPLRERLRAAHMRALYRAGRQSDALASFAELRDRLADELGLDPGRELAELQEAILRQDPTLDVPAAPATPAPARPRTNLPTPLTALVGRDAAVGEVCSLLAANRLVTLAGPGGVGKTRLAIETAGRLVGSFPDGAWLAELAPVGRPGDRDAVESLTEVVMAVLGIRDDVAAPAAEPVTPVDRLAGALHAKRLLLVLDNCEHVVEPVAELATLLLKTAPELRILATSQEPLALAGEAVFDVQPLEPPAEHATDPHAVERSSAARLFVARAAAAAPGFALDAGNASAVAVLCRRLDGIPLALELAATRVRALGVHGLVARLDDRFRLLDTGHRGAPPRQRTLRAMIDWSWELLTEPERVVLRRLAIHADGCTLEAAEHVCAGDGVPQGDVVGLLARLVDRCMVVATGSAGDPADRPRYRLLESVAEYCTERLREAGELDEVRRRHHDHYVGLAERAAPQLYGPAQREWLERLDRDGANLRAALDGILRDGVLRDGGSDLALRMVNAMAWYWFMRGRLAEATRSLDAALKVADAGVSEAAARARAMAWQVGLDLLAGDLRDPVARSRAVLRLYDDVDDPEGRARAEWFLGFALSDFGDLAVSEELVEHALAAFRERGDRWGVAAALSTRAKHAIIRGDLAAVRDHGERSLALFRELGDRWGQLQASEWLGELAEVDGDYEHATRLHQDGLRMAEELGLWPQAADRLTWLGRIRMLLGDYPAARQIQERARELAVGQGYKPGEIFAEMGLGPIARREGRLDLAEAHLRKVLEWYRGTAVQAGPALWLSLAELGFVTEQRGDAGTAQALHDEAFEVARGLGDPRAMALALEGLAGAHALAGRHERAALLLGAASAARASAGAPLPTLERGDVDRIATTVRAALGEAAFAAAFDRGCALAPDEAHAVSVG